MQASLDLCAKLIPIASSKSGTATRVKGEASESIIH